MDQGLIYVFTGDGKGKTSAALGVAIRALASGMSVAIVQWYKNPSWRISEHSIEELLTPAVKTRFSIFPMGKGFHLQNRKIAPLTTGQAVVDTATPQEHQTAAAQALIKAGQLIHQVDLLILDEINNAVSDQLIDLQAVLKLLSQRGTTHLILTGRSADSEIVKIADLVSSINKIKHPYDQGQPAVKGLDF